ncbi:MAG: helix-turn-helix domain-containing protein [Streptomycetaceae bacterium]|nr:helix-turn-helix domain-containing protein [Streptomycetaceae bacterium]
MPQESTRGEPAPLTADWGGAAADRGVGAAAPGSLPGSLPVSRPASPTRRVRPTREQAAGRRRDLGDFIRSRRERTTPEMVGLPPGPRRRTPGLRREEVALLAGIGVTWYTWLEQGRSINVSAQVLLSVVRVLGLDDVERAHVFRLAELPDPELVVSVPQVGEGMLAVLDQLSPFPAAVIGPRWEILASNRAHVGLMGDYPALPACSRNIIWLVFTDPGWRSLTGNWEVAARSLVAKMRGASTADAGDPGWAQLLDRLRSASPEFRELWDRQDVLGFDNAIKCLYHHELGTLNLQTVNMVMGDQRGVRVTVYTPRDEETREKLAGLPTVTPRTIEQVPEAVAREYLRGEVLASA